MRVVGIIQARMSSTRLPNKVLMPILGRPLLGWMIDRVKLSSGLDELVIATSTDECDDQIEQFAKSEGCKVFRGSRDDVLDRYYQAALLFKAEVIVRLTADCPLHDYLIIDHLIESFKVGGYDYLSNSEPLPSTWPDGVDVSIFTMGALTKAWASASKPSEREHVTFHFWRNSQLFKCKRIDSLVDYSKYRITIDYPEDLLLLKAVMENFGRNGSYNFSMLQIIHFLDENPKVFSLNSAYSHGIGWNTALRLDKELGF